MIAKWMDYKSKKIFHIRIKTIKCTDRWNDLNLRLNNPNRSPKNQPIKCLQQDKQKKALIYQVLKNQIMKISSKEEKEFSDNTKI